MTEGTKIPCKVCGALKDPRGMATHVYSAHTKEEALEKGAPWPVSPPSRKPGKKGAKKKAKAVKCGPYKKKGGVAAIFGKLSDAPVVKIDAKAAESRAVEALLGNDLAGLRELARSAALALVREALQEIINGDDLASKLAARARHLTKGSKKS